MNWMNSRKGSWACFVVIAFVIMVLFFVSSCSVPKPTTPLAPTDTSVPTTTIAPALTDTPTITSPPTATDTPTPTYLAPTLVNPAPGANITGETLTNFSWQWDGALQEGEKYDLRIWRPEKPCSTIDMLYECSYLLDAPPDGFGQYQWQVAVVQVDESGNKSTLSESLIWPFVWSDVPPTSTPTATPTPTPTPAPDAVIVAPVNLRSGPGTMYDIISTLSPGQVLTVTGRIADTTWLQVITDQMQEGWVVNWANLVTLNLSAEQISIVSTPPPPTEPPMPTQMSFQNFEPDNGTPGDYCRDVWFATCSFESTIVREGSRAVRVHAYAEVDGKGSHGGTVSIYPSSSDPIDLSSATTLSIWMYDTQGNNTVELRLRDYNDALSNNVWSEMQAEQNNWTEITWSLSDFTGVDLSQIKNIELYEWWDGVYYFDAVSWEFISALESTPCPYQAVTDENTIAQLIQAESEAVKKEDISIIQAIFAEDAIIRDAVSGDTWNDPIIRYEALFTNVDFTHAIHPEIQPAGDGITTNAAWFISGSRGSYEGVGFSGSYDNPPGSDHWTFGKNSFGCWIITEFTFNASHIPFPP